MSVVDHDMGVVDHDMGVVDPDVDIFLRHFSASPHSKSGEEEKRLIWP
jgi:hypothetical protein